MLHDLVLAAGGGVDVPGWLVPGISALAGFLVTLLSGKIVVPTFAYLREKERAEKWEAEVMRLNGLLAEKVIPTLTLTAKAMEDSTEAVQQALTALARER